MKCENHLVSNFVTSPHPSFIQLDLEPILPKFEGIFVSKNLSGGGGVSIYVRQCNTVCTVLIFLNFIIYWGYLINLLLTLHLLGAHDCQLRFVSSIIKVLNLICVDFNFFIIYISI